MNVLDVLLNKGKGLILGKLRTIQLIEVDLQLVMRIFLGCRNKGSIEKDPRLLKFNCGSRRFYSIDKAILEKRLIYDISRYNKQSTIHMITNLEAYYNQQLYNIGLIVKESVRIDWNGIKLIVKVLPRMKHHICTGFGLSSALYSNERQQIGETG